MSHMRSVRKPPIPKSPMHLRSRRILRSTPSTAQSPPGSLIKTQLPNHSSNAEESELRPEYCTISSELRALAKMVQDEFGKPDFKTGVENTFGSISRSPLFERGRFYDEYSTRRNERLKKKNGQTGKVGERKTVYNLGVKIESAKKRERLDGLKKSVFSTPMTENRRENSRYLLRSMNKENKKPPLPVKYESSVTGKLVTRRIQKR